MHSELCDRGANQRNSSIVSKLTEPKNDSYFRFVLEMNLTFSQMLSLCVLIYLVISLARIALTPIFS